MSALDLAALNDFLRERYDGVGGVMYCEAHRLTDRDGAECALALRGTDGKVRFVTVDIASQRPWVVAQMMDSQLANLLRASR